MAFIGMDGAEHKIRQLTSQLQSKDAELASVRNELIKKSEALAEEVKAKQALRYQMEQDSRGIESSSKDTSSLKNEVSILRQNLTNRETALGAANETIKKLEKANQGLEYELQCAGSNSDESSRRLLEQKNKLETEVKGLKQELQRRDSEDIRLKAANAKVAAESSMQPPSGIPRLKRPPSRNSNANFFGSAPSPAPGPSKIPQSSSTASSVGSNRRRSTSLSNTREIELQARVSALETQLAGTRTKLDKAENQIMAVQRSSKKHAEDVERKLDEANDELEFYRSQGTGETREGGSKGEMEQLRKSRDALKGTVEGLMQDLEGARGEIEALRAKVEVLDQQREEEAARTIFAAAITPATDGSSEEVNSLRSRIATLESDLAKAQTGTPETSDEDDLAILSGLRKEIRKLKKELSLTQHMVSEAEKERDEFEEELDAIRAAGGERGKKSGVDEAELLAAKEALAGAEKRMGELEVELQGLRVEIGEARAEREAEVVELRSRAELSVEALASAQSELVAAQSALSDKQAELAAAIDASSSLQSSHDRLSANLQEQTTETEAKARELAQCRVDLETAQQAVSTVESSLETAQIQADEAQTQLAELVEVENLLIAARAEVEELKSALGEMEALEFGARQERDQARVERDAVEERIKAAAAELAAAEGERKLAVQEAEHERATIQATRSELEDSKKRLATRLLEIEEYSDQLQLAAADISKLEQRNAELEEGLANRSTESEAQHRQEEVFQLKEDLEGLRAQYAAKEAELVGKTEEAAVSKAKVAELEAVLGAARVATDALASASLAPPEPTPHAHLLHAKIEKLRIERDELRQTMSFAKHEHRFALQAAEADRASAMEELHRAKLDLKHRSADTDRLSAELSGHRDQLQALQGEIDNLRGRMAEVSTEKNDALDQQILQLQSELEESKADRENMRESSVGFFTRHSALQAECDAAGERYAELSGHFQALQGQYSDVQRRLVEAEKSRTVALAERDECLEKIDGLRLAEPAAAAVGTGSAGSAVMLGASEGVGAVEARLKRDMRRSSLMAYQDHAALEQGKRLELLESRLREEKERVLVEQGKVVDEQARVKRREAAILSLHQRVEKAEWNAQLARDESDEKAEEAQEAAEAARVAHEQRVTELQDELSAAREGHAEAQAALAVAQAALAESEGTVEALRAAIARSAEEGSMLTSQLADAVSGRQAVDAQLATSTAANTALERSTSVLILTLANVQSTSLASQLALDAQIQSITALEASIAISETQISVLQAERDNLRAEVGSADATTTREMEALRSEQVVLKSQIEGLEVKCRGLEGELEMLMADMGAAEEAHAVEMGEKVEELRRVKKEVENVKRVAEEREAEVSARGSELEGRSAAAVAERDGAKAELEAEKKVAVERAAKLANLETVLASAEATTASHARDLDAKQAELDALREELVEQQRSAGEKEVTLESMLAELETAVEVLKAERDTIKKGWESEKRAVEAREEVLRVKLGEVEGELVKVREAKAGESGEVIDELKAAVERSMAELAEVTAALDKANDELESLRVDGQRSAEDQASRIAEVASLESKLAESIAALEAATAERDGLEQRLNLEVTELHERIRALSATEGELRAGAEEAETKVTAAEEARAEMQARLDEVESMAEKEKEAAEGLRVEMGRLESQLAAVQGMADEQQEQVVALSKQVEDTQAELAVVQADLQSMTERLESKQAELDGASSRNADLSARLEQASSAPSAKAEAIEALEHQLQELQAICQSKDNDVDIATDHMTAAVVDKNKALVKIGKLERKIAKLEKTVQSAAATAEREETARNTAANLLLMKPTERDLGVMPPPPLPVARPTPAPTSTSSTPIASVARQHAPSPAQIPLPPSAQSTPITLSSSSPATSLSRQPLRSVNVFDKSQMPLSFAHSTPSLPPKTGSKRSRDAEADDAVLPADAVMQPLQASLLPPAVIPPGSMRKAVRGGFTPQRNAFAPVASPGGGGAPGVGGREAKENRPAGPGIGAGAGGKGNVCAESTPRRNPFAVDP